MRRALALLVLVLAVPALAQLRGISYPLTPGAAVAINHSTAQLQTLVPNQATAITATNVRVGYYLYLLITTSGTSSYTLTFGSGFTGVSSYATGTTSGVTCSLAFLGTSGGTLREVAGSCRPLAVGAPFSAAGDVEAVNVTTTAPMTGGANCASGTCAFTLNVPDFVGDSGAGGTRGLVPAPAAGDAAAAKFLSAAGTWAAPAGSGDVTQVFGCTSGDCSALAAAAGDSLDMGGGDSSTPCTVGNTLPATCAVGACHFDSDATAGENVYGCTAIDTWTLQGDGGGAGGGTPAQSTFVADRNISLGTAWRYRVGGYIELAPALTFTTAIADCKATPPLSWTATSTTNLTSCDVDTSVSDAMYFVHNTSSTDDYDLATQTAPFYYKVYKPTKNRRRWIARLAGTSGTNKYWQMTFQYNAASSQLNGRILINGGTPAILNSINSLSCTSPEAAPSVVSGDIETGIWMAIEQVSNSIRMLVSKNTSATPPADFVTIRACTTAEATWPEWDLRVGVALLRAGATTGNVDLKVLYWDDTGAQTSVDDAPPLTAMTPAYGAQGFPSGDQDLRMIDSWDLGHADATIADTALQNAFVGAINQRGYDAASITCSYVRGSGASPACGSYGACSSSTVSGTGRYLAVCTRWNSSGQTQPGSLHVPSIAGPYVPTP